MRALLIAAALALVAPAAAHAGGGVGIASSYGGKGITNPQTQYTYFAVPAGNDSVIQRFSNGEMDRWRTLKGNFAVPQAAWDGSRTGLSADGRTLVLAESPRTFPVRTTRLMILDVPRLTIRQRITLTGHSSVSGVSPDGGVIFLTRYPRPIDDPDGFVIVAHARGDGSQRIMSERMSGWPYSGITSADGRWEFTLYDGEDGPFLHQLDVRDQSLVRIDLPQLSGRDLASEKLRLDGGTVAIGDLAAVDPETQAVTLTSRTPVIAGTPRPRTTATATPARPPAEDGSSAWPFAALGLVAIGALALLVTRRRSAQEVEDVQVTVHHADEHPSLRR